MSGLMQYQTAGGLVAIAFDRKRKVSMKEAVEYLRTKGREIAIKTLYNLICDGRGPRREKKGGRLMFTLDDLDAWDRGETETFEAHQK